ncbi:MAG: hypothetical protein K2Y05_11830, partial [Hyphomicrobiaceae bacterium]|nr:hypothetical protein [Hyphomicrobiaceae bacterium]
MSRKQPDAAEAATNSKSKDYEVGFGKPPRHSQFQPGRSGNPRGRPRGRLNLATILQNTLDKKVSINEGGKPKIVSKRELMYVNAVNNAIKGDARSLMTLISIKARVGSKDLEPVLD